MSNSPKAPGKVASFFMRSWLVFLVASLTLGLAPFSPEPRLWEKIRWMPSGTFPMEGVYIFDTFLHGTPWVLFLIGAIFQLRYRVLGAQEAN